MVLFHINTLEIGFEDQRNTSKELINYDEENNNNNNVEFCSQFSRLVALLTGGITELRSHYCVVSDLGHFTA